MNKPWAEKLTAETLGYTDHTAAKLTKHSHHVRFSDWVYGNFKKEDISIFDIGCGPAWVLNLLPTFNKYVGIDINEACLESAINYCSREGVSFYPQDIEEDLDLKVIQEIKNCNICYVDSVFTMLEDPQKVLVDILLPNFNFIYLDRTCSPHHDPITEKKSFSWPGMSSHSAHWAFSKSFFEEILRHRPHTLEIVEDSVIISNA